MPDHPTRHDLLRLRSGDPGGGVIEDRGYGAAADRHIVMWVPTAVAGPMSPSMPEGRLVWWPDRTVGPARRGDDRRAGR
ncbi:hypothetical protein Ssi02_25350 [Sinosporangium siamense]|uniref:Uncharacterized protein n=1 Tax=Sinosporangium siamense TaxID=1367973 RepID=A0A919RI74_9ACTN|nr:hypothetical protein Ssi02_25350 [Sinosporangium siamense]